LINRKLIPFVVKNEGTLVQGHYYTCMPYQQQNPTDSEKKAYSQQRKLLQLITNLPDMTVRLGKLQRKHNSFVQKRVDVLLALDMARYAWKNKIDTAILIAGDSDFVPAIDEVMSCGVKTVLYYYQPAFNNDLLHSVTESHEITQEIYQNFVRL